MAGIALEPEILVINSNSCGACASLAVDATQADLVGIDAEWAPDWDNDTDNPISVLQLAFPRSGRVYILQLEQMERLPTEVQMMLINSEVLRVGFAVRGTDVSKFQRSGIAIGEFLDLQNACEMMACAAGILLQPSSMGLAHAVRLVLVEEMGKDKRVSCSNWAATVLTREQVHYAAMDAWVLLRLYGAVCYQFGHTPDPYYLSGNGWQDQDIFLDKATPPRQAVNSRTQYDAAAGKVSVGGAISSSRELQPLEPVVGTTTSNVTVAAIPEASSPRVCAPKDGETAMSRRRVSRARDLTRHVDTYQEAPSAKRATVCMHSEAKFCDPSDLNFRHFKLAAMLVSFLSFFVFPLGLPALVLIPLHLLLVWVLRRFKVIPQPPPALMTAYVEGCCIRIVAGICSFGFRYFFTKDVVGTS